MRIAICLAALVSLSLATAALAQTPAPKVLIRTSQGDIAVELDPEHAPVTVENFLHYVNAHHYDGTVVYRVAPGFVIQAGSYEADGKKRAARDPIPLEAGNGLSNLRGTLAMARTANPNSATAEFFVNLVDNVRLDRAPGDTEGGYAVFGRVVTGMEVVDAIAAVPLGGIGPMPASAPATPVTIVSVTPAN